MKSSNGSRRWRYRFAPPTFQETRWKPRARGIDAVRIDYNRPETLHAAFGGIDRLFLLAPSVLYQAQLELNAIEAAKGASVKHIVKLSVWKADEERYAFARLNRAIEKAIEASGISWTFLRPNDFMQKS